jgi:hypothetical protein
MTDRHNPQRMVTFKAEESLIEAMEGIPNRSAFIRAAILAALDSACPLCHGTGVLSPNQRRHWQDFAESHPLVMCSDCNEKRLSCVAESS